MNITSPPDLVQEQGTLLLDEAPMIVLPSLARAIGINAAVLLQQVHFWVCHNKKSDLEKGTYHHYHNGLWWMYNSMTAWQRQCPWWSLSTVRRIIDTLKETGILITACFNRAGYDRTRWYTVNYDELRAAIARQAIDQDPDPPFAHFEQMDMLKLNTCMISDRTHGSAQNEQMDVVKLSAPIPEITKDMLPDTNQIWKTCLTELKMQMTQATYDRWFADIKLEIMGSQAILICRDDYAAEWLQARWDTPIRRTLAPIADLQDLEIEYVVEKKT